MNFGFFFISTMGKRKSEETQVVKRRKLNCKHSHTWLLSPLYMVASLRNLSIADKDRDRALKLYWKASALYEDVRTRIVECVTKNCRDEADRLDRTVLTTVRNIFERGVWSPKNVRAGLYNLANEL